MKHTLTILLSLALASPFVSATSPTASDGTDALLSQSRAHVKQLATSLLNQLQSAVESQGLSNSLEVCKSVAMPLTAANQPRDGSVRRVALRLRNPQNAPDPWEMAILSQFLTRSLQGEQVAGLEHYQVVETHQGARFRYIKAIPTGQLCLGCHGNEIAPEVQAKLAQHYPQDLATGFKLGELRGAFSVSIPLETREPE